MFWFLVGMGSMLVSSWLGIEFAIFALVCWILSDLKFARAERQRDNEGKDL